MALALTGLISQDSQLVRAVDLAMELTAWFVIVPLAFASLLTGIVQSLGTSWGLFRHYWVVTKLLLTCFATIVLLIKMGPIGRVAAGTLGGTDLHHIRIELVAHACGGLVVLLAITTISVFKPWGKTGYGRRVGERQRPALAGAVQSLAKAALLTPYGAQSQVAAPKMSLGVKIGIAALFVILFIVLHLTAGKFMFHGH